mmetsp:Transcript_38263/g.44594  ORF Transcript_38263/g.44594 Transcript_38263/m.44594 type:complete len:302 (+) Transcript_38263:106-1011(+)
MDVWFEAAQAKFMTFLDEKMNVYGAAVAACVEEAACVGEDDDVSRFLLNSDLKVIPSSCIDGVHLRMETVYFPLGNGYTTTSGDEEGGDAAAVFLYGELLPEGVRQLLQLPAVQRSLCSVDVPPHTIPTFVDFGSGTGKVVFEAALLLQHTPSPASSSPSKEGIRCVGIELHPERYAIAMEALQSGMCGGDGVEQEVVLRKGWCHYVNGSFFDAFPFVEDACVIFACALGFDDRLTAQLLDRIFELKHQQKSPHLRCAVLLLRSLPLEHPIFHTSAAVSVTSTMLKTSWMDETPAIVLENF